jgi:hypothetical protein
MPDIFTVTNGALESINPTVPFEMDEFTGDLPDTYLVYYVITGAGQEHADNQETARTYRVQVSIMNRSGLTNLPDVDTAMTAAGFTKGPERELRKDPTTSHYGLAKDYFFLM